jgi:hypothetical protein
MLRSPASPRRTLIVILVFPVRRTDYRQRLSDRRQNAASRQIHYRNAAAEVTGFVKDRSTRVIALLRHRSSQNLPAQNSVYVLHLAVLVAGVTTLRRQTKIHQTAFQGRIPTNE